MTIRMTPTLNRYCRKILRDKFNLKAMARDSQIT